MFVCLTTLGKISLSPLNPKWKGCEEVYNASWDIIHVFCYEKMMFKFLNHRIYLYKCKRNFMCISLK